MQGPKINVEQVSLKAIELVGDRTVVEEGFEPQDQGRGKAEVAEHFDKTARVDIVKEALDVKKDKRASIAGFQSVRDVVGEAHRRVHSAAIVAGPELRGQDKLIDQVVVEDAGGHYLL